MRWPPKTEKYDALGMQIYEAIKKCGMSANQLAHEVGISLPYLTDIMQGNRPTSPRIPVIKEFLKIK